jgi:hypothetical protein
LEFELLKYKDLQSKSEVSEDKLAGIQEIGRKLLEQLERKQESEETSAIMQKQHALLIEEL